jgi:hypothetical protein
MFDFILKTVNRIPYITNVVTDYSNAENGTNVDIMIGHNNIILI